MNSRQILFALLRMQICGTDVCEEVQKALSTQRLEEVYSLASKHDLAHIAGQALSDLGCLGNDEISQQFKKQAMLAVYRCTKMERELQSICNALEKAQIPYLPLKGAVIRKYYPEPWMRTSCDIDLLVKESNLDIAADVLARELGYENKGKNNHDLSMFSPNGVHFELHYTAVEQERFLKAQTFLGQMWEYTSCDEAATYHHTLKDEMFYFYHIAHMAKHIENGGCGMKPFLDLWILDHRVAHDRQKREELLKMGGLLTFAKAAEKLSEVWFSGAEADILSRNLEQYVLVGGVYGTLKNSVAVKQAQKGGKLQYLLYKIWVPYNIIKYYYPVLQKHKWLTPVYQVRRWIRLVFGGGLGHAVQTMKTNAGMEMEARSSVRRLLDELGL